MRWCSPRSPLARANISSSDTFAVPPVIAVWRKVTTSSSRGRGDRNGPLGSGQNLLDQVSPTASSLCMGATTLLPSQLRRCARILSVSWSTSAQPAGAQLMSAPEDRLYFGISRAKLVNDLLRIGVAAERNQTRSTANHAQGAVRRRLGLEHRAHFLSVLVQPIDRWLEMIEIRNTHEGDFRFQGHDPGFEVLQRVLF